MERVYVAGQFRNPSPELVNINIIRAQRAGAKIAAKGCFPVVPHSMTAGFNELQPAEFWLEATMEEMLTCDAVFFMPGWEESEGCKEEYRVAAERGMRIIHDLEEL